MSQKASSRALSWCLALAAVFVGSSALASTVATFSWVATSAVTTQSPPTPQTGSLTLTLPDTITTQTFDTGNLGSSALALADLTGFTYTFSDGLTVNLADLNLSTSSLSGSSFNWKTSNVVTPGLGGGSGVYLITGFTLKGSKVFPGDPRAANFQIANAAGQLNLIASDANTITPFAGQGVASNDAGYWKLSSFQTATPVPLPAALPLMLLGLAGLGGAVRRRQSATA